MSLAETADRLGVSAVSVRRMVRDGYLRAVYPIGRSKAEQPQFRSADVAALVELRAQNLGIAEIAALAKMATLRVGALERQLARLMETVGADIPSLDFSEAGVLKLRADMESLLSLEYPNITAELVFDWARNFYVMGEEYFAAVEQHTADREPWILPFRTVAKLLAAKPQLHDPELDTAYRYLQLGRRFMRQAAYFYVRQQHGTRTAHRLFREVDGDVNHRILSMVFAAQN